MRSVQVQLAFFLPARPDEGAIVQIETVNRRRIGGCEDYLAPGDDGSRRRPAWLRIIGNWPPFRVAHPSGGKVAASVFGFGRLLDDNITLISRTDLTECKFVGFVNG